MPRQLIACALMLLSLTACIHWRTRSGMGLHRLITTEHPTTIRVTLRNGSVMVLDQPRMTSANTLSGVSNGAQSSIAASDVTEVAVRGVNERGTTVLFVGGAVAVIAALVAIQK
jgi:hypothetical protein